MDPSAPLRQLLTRSPRRGPAARRFRRAGSPSARTSMIVPGFDAVDRNRGDRLVECRVELLARRFRSPSGPSRSRYACKFQREPAGCPRQKRIAVGRPPSAGGQARDRCCRPPAAARGSRRRSSSPRSSPRRARLACGRFSRSACVRRARSRYSSRSAASLREWISSTAFCFGPRLGASEPQTERAPGLRRGRGISACRPGNGLGIRRVGFGAAERRAASCRRLPRAVGSVFDYVIA